MGRLKIYWVTGPYRVKHIVIAQAAPVKSDRKFSTHGQAIKVVHRNFCDNLIRKPA